MRAIPRVLAVTALLVVAMSAARAAESDTSALINEFKGTAPAQTRTPQALQAAYETVIQALAPDLGSDDIGKRSGAMNTFEAIALRAGRPGAEAERAALSKAIAAKLPTVTAPLARNWLIRQLQHVGRAEAVGALVVATGDKDPVTRDAARRALQYNPSPQAGAALVTELTRATTPEWRVAIINALGGRRESAAVPLVGPLVRGADEPVALAAAQTLGRIGGPQAAAILAGAVRAKTSPALHAAIVDSYMLCGDQLVAEGKKDAAATIFKDLYTPTESRAIRIAALRGLVVAQGEKAVALIGELLTDADPQMQAIAVGLMKDVTGPGATAALAGLMPKMSPAGQAALLAELGARGDPAGKQAVLAAMKSTDDLVSAAAVRAMAGLGEAADVPMLAKMAADTQGAGHNAIAETLVRLGAKGVDEAMIQGVAAGDAKVRVELIRALAARRTTAAGPALAKGIEDSDPGVRAEAAAALGVLGDEKVLPAIVAILVKAQGDAERETSQKAVASIISRIAAAGAAKDACEAPILAAVVAAATGPAKASLLALLAQTGSPKALAAVRAAAKDADAAVQDAALRALAAWPTADPADDLLAIAKTDAKAARQVLALRGYVRMAGLGDVPATQRAKMLQEAFAAAKRPEDRKLVLAGAADAPSLESLTMVKTYLADPDLKAEAAVAAVRIAAAIGGSDRDEATAVLKAIMQAPPSDGVKQQAQEALNNIEKNEDYITAWVVSGPWTQKDKDGAALFDVAFPPETAAATAAAKWKPLPGGSTDGPGIINLNKALGATENCCGYLRTAVFSPKAQEALLELGSDDGVKAWFNGKVVIANNANRGIAPGSDKAKIQLAQGWNVLLLKITQGGADWAASARIRAAGGGRLEGLRIRPDGDAAK